MITITERKISAEDYNYLTDQVGWGMREVNVVEEALRNTLYSVTVYDEEKVIGFGRMIGDRTIFLYVQDIMVLPGYQGQGIGTKIMNQIVGKIREYKGHSPSLRAYLGTSKGKEGFYEKFGFRTRSEEDLGEGMVLL